MTKLTPKQAAAEAKRVAKGKAFWSARQEKLQAVCPHADVRREYLSCDSYYDPTVYYCHITCKVCGAFKSLNNDHPAYNDYWAEKQGLTGFE